MARLDAIAAHERTAWPGIGAGVRFSLLNWVEATAGYSVRLRRRRAAPREWTGAPFVELRFRDPFESGGRRLPPK